MRSRSIHSPEKIVRKNPLRLKPASNGREEQPHLVWVVSGSLTRELDSSTVLEMTRELRRLGWRVSLLCIGQPGIQQIRGVEVSGLPTLDTYFLRHIIFHLRVWVFLARNWSNIDFVMFHQVSAFFLLPVKGIFSWLERHPKWVMDTRTVLMEDVGRSNWKGYLRGLHYQVAAPMANRWADGQTAITPRMAEQVKIPTDQLWCTWQSGVNPEFFRPALSARTWPEDPQPIRLAYIGVLHRERNLSALCRAVIKANQAAMRFQLTLTGQGTAWQELVELAGRSGGMIEVCPSVPHEQIPSILADAHVGALPFPDQERFRVSSPLKLFEYLAAGMPILATRITCHTQVLSASGCVFWAEDDSPEQLVLGLERLWDQRAELESMGRQASQLAESHTWKAFAQVLSDSLLSHLDRSAVGILSG